MIEDGPGRGDGFSVDRRELFLTALARGETVLAACALVGVSNRTAYNHRAKDPGFARAWEIARKASSAPVELEAWRRGVIGEEEPVYRYGKLSHVRVRRSDRLLIELLRGASPLKYGRAAGLEPERQRIEARLDRRLDVRLAAALAPLAGALAAVTSDLAALRWGDGGAAVNFVNRPDAVPAPPRLRRKRRLSARKGPASARKFEQNASAVNFAAEALDRAGDSRQGGRLAGEGEE